MNPKNLAVFVSGSGTNLENIAKCIEQGKLTHCKIALVVCDNPEAYALKRAKRFNIETFVVNRNDYKSKPEFEDVIVRALETSNVDYIALAGFMRILSQEFVKRFGWKIINVHPALLPKFPGAHAIRDAWEAGIQESGVTVHFVDSGIDTGPVILQKKVVRDASDTLESFEQKIHQVEYELYPQAVQMLVDGKLSVSGGKVVIH